MEEKKNHSSLPSNYVTLAQLQERWFNQHNNPHNPQPQNPQPPKQTHHQEIRTASQSHPQNHYVVKNRGAPQLASDDHRKSEAGAGIGDKTGHVNGNKTSGWKNKKWKNKMKPKTKTEEASGAAAKRDEEAEKRTIDSDLKENKNHHTEKDTIHSETNEEKKNKNHHTEKDTIQSETKEEKNGHSVTIESVQHRVRVSSINSRNGKLGKMNNRRFQSQRNGGSVTTEESVEEKVRVSSMKMNSGSGEGNGDSVTTEESVEEKVRVSSMNSGNGEGNGELGKMKNALGHSQSQRNGGSVTTDSVEERIKVSSMNSGNGERNGKLGKMKNGFRRSQSSHWNRKVEVLRREKMVWVKKE